MSTDTLLKPSSGGRQDQLQDQLYYTTSACPDDTQDYLIFFMAGNPGVIYYYEHFLSTLCDLLQNSYSGKAHFIIRGHSYKGFEEAVNPADFEQPADLNDQIKYQEDILYEHVQKARRVPKVILMGHSVGSYVLLEIIRHHVERIKSAKWTDFDLIGGILLFPTIAEIAQSQMGKVARYILQLPGFPRIVGALAHGLTYCLPDRALKLLIRTITRHAEYAVNTTAKLLRSPMGIRQALHLANDEMKTITADKWDDEVRGAATSLGTNTRDTINWNLVLFWGNKDSWVADHTRDYIIEAWGNQSAPGTVPSMEGKPVMEVDTEKGLPHDFCTTIDNSNYVASKVNCWISDIIDKHHRAI